MIINIINMIIKKYWKIKIEYKLKNAGINNVNSISYSIRKTHIIEKLKFIWIFTSLVDLKPHS